MNLKKIIAKLKIKKPMRMVICVHESGHAVAQVVTKVGCGGARITMQDVLSAGHAISIADIPAVPDPDFAHEIVNAAGEAAVELYRPGGSDEMKRTMGADALKKATAAFAECGIVFNPETDRPRSDGEKIATAAITRGYTTEAGRLEYEEILLNRVTALVDIHWDAILSVAEELYLYSEISGHRVAEIVAECSRRPAKREYDKPCVQYVRTLKRKFARESMSLAV